MTKKTIVLAVLLSLMASELHAQFRQRWGRWALWNTYPLTQRVSGAPIPNLTVNLLKDQIAQGTCVLVVYNSLTDHMTATTVPAESCE